MQWVNGFVFQINLSLCDIKYCSGEDSRTRFAPVDVSVSGSHWSNSNLTNYVSVETISDTIDSNVNTIDSGTKDLNLTLPAGNFSNENSSLSSTNKNTVQRRFPN